MIQTVALLILMVLAVDVLVIITPWLMPDTECFAVTVPHGQRAKEPLSGLMRAYATRMAAISGLCLLAWPVAFWLFDLDLSTERGSDQLALLVSLAMCVPMLASFVLMLHYRGRTQAIKREMGWRVEHARSAALVGDEDFPRPVSVLWNLAYVPLVAGMVSFALVNYDRFPDMIPVNMDFDGTVVTTAPKSLGALLFPAVVTAFIGLVITACHVGIVRSKKPLDPNAPASTALAYGRFARVQSIVMLVGGLALSATTGIAFYASSLGTLSMAGAAMLTMVSAVAFAVAMLIVSVRMGQSGARIAAQVNASDMARDDDRYWLLGTIYCSREDPSLFVPKRFGIGWTLNMGRPVTWVAITAFALVTALFVWASTTMLS